MSEGSGDGLEYLTDVAPAPGERRAVVDGVDWIRQPLPFRLDHVNCWWLDGGEGRGVQVDTGIASDTTRRHWADALGGRRPDALLVTHFHPDHAGLAGEYFRDGIALLGSAIEARLSAHIWSMDDRDCGARYAAWYRRHGLADETVAEVAARGNGYRRIVAEPPPPARVSSLAAGELVRLGGRDWRVHVGAGHAPAMLMLHDERAGVLVAADQVLPGISPNVSVAPGADDAASTDPLRLFLDSLDALRALPPDTVVLPSHGLPFRGLHARIDALARHHEERLAAVLDACAEPRSAAELFAVLFGRRLDAQQTSFALGESLAHLHRLEACGEIVRLDEGERVRWRRH